MEGLQLDGLSEYATSVVRLFPDYAETPIWFMEPVSYEKTRLDARLVRDLQTWDATYYAALARATSWSQPMAGVEYITQGALLARRIAEQIGDQFQVEHRAPQEPHQLRRVRSSRAAGNPQAEAAFQQLAAHPWP